MKNYVTVQEMRQKKKQQQIDIKNKIDMEVGKAARGILKIVFSNGEERIVFSDDCRRTSNRLLKEWLMRQGNKLSYSWLEKIKKEYQQTTVNDFQFIVLFVESEYEKI